MQEEVDAGRFRMIVDCAGLTYISSAGLGVFMSFVEDVREKGGDIKICGLTETVYQVFDILGFPALFDIVPDRQAAVDKFCRTGGRRASHGLHGTHLSIARAVVHRKPVDDPRFRGQHRRARRISTSGDLMQAWSWRWMRPAPM